MCKSALTVLQWIENFDSSIRDIRTLTSRIGIKELLLPFCGYESSENFYRDNRALNAHL